MLLLHNIPTRQSHFNLQFYRVRDLQLTLLTKGVTLKFTAKFKFSADNGADAGVRHVPPRTPTAVV